MRKVVIGGYLILALSASAQPTRDLAVEVFTPDGERIELYENSWAVLIGINDYHRPNISALNYAEADVDAMQTTLQKLGFERIIVLKGDQATRNRILEVLGDQLPNEVGPEDRVIIYFAGHGHTEKLASDERGYLVPVDGDSRRPYSTAISMDRLRDLAKRIPAKHIFFAVDACYSGFALVRSQGADPRDWLSVQRSARLKAKQIVTAGRAGEVAVEEKGHGLFTQLLIQGLSGDADRFPPHGILTGSELCLYVNSYLPLESNHQQTPQFGRLSAGEGEFMFVLKRSEEELASEPVTVAAPVEKPATFSEEPVSIEEPEAETVAMSVSGEESSISSEQPPGVPASRPTLEQTPPVEKGIFFTPKLGASMYSGMVGFGIQFSQLGIDLGHNLGVYAGDTYIIGGIKFFFKPYASTFYFGGCTILYDGGHFLGGGIGYRWRSKSGFEFTIGGGMGQDRWDYGDSGDKGSDLFPVGDVSLGRSFSL